MQKMQETRVQFLIWEDPLEEETATYSSIPAWRISWEEKPGGLQSMGLQRAGHDWATEHSMHTACMNYTESWQKVRECRIDDGFGFVVFVCPVRPRGYMTYQSLLKKPCCQKWNLGFQIHKKQWITNSYGLELKNEWLMALRLPVNHSESVWVQ